MKMLQPQVQKSGCSMFTPAPAFPKICLATAIRRFFKDSNVQPSGMESSLKSFRRRRMVSL